MQSADEREKFNRRACTGVPLPEGSSTIRCERVGSLGWDWDWDRDYFGGVDYPVTLWGRRQEWDELNLKPCV